MGIWPVETASHVPAGEQSLQKTWYYMKGVSGSSFLGIFHLDLIRPVNSGLMALSILIRILAVPHPPGGGGGRGTAAWVRGVFFQIDLRDTTSMQYVLLLRTRSSSSLNHGPECQEKLGMLDKSYSSVGTTLGQRPALDVSPTKICQLSSQHGAVGERFTEPTRLHAISACLVYC